MLFILGIAVPAFLASVLLLIIFVRRRAFDYHKATAAMAAMIIFSGGFLITVGDAGQDRTLVLMIVVLGLLAIGSFYILLRTLAHVFAQRQD